MSDSNKTESPPAVGTAAAAAPKGQEKQSGALGVVAILLSLAIAGLVLYHYCGKARKKIDENEAEKLR